MQLLKNRILKDGKVYPNNILKVDSFLNHQVDLELVENLSKEFFRLFESDKVNKILTIEASGIVLAGFTAKNFGVPMVFAKKSQTKNISSDVFSSKIMSYTHSKVYDIVVSKDYLSSSDRVLIIDDFLAKGEALKGLISLVKQSGATLVGCGIAIEKAFQKGGDSIRAEGVRVESLARILSMTDSDLVISD